MENEDLFLMLEQCVELASQQLISDNNLESFAMVLDHNNKSSHVDVKETQGEERYEALLSTLRTQAKDDKISAIALLSNVTIPDNFNPEVNTGIRIHIEEKTPSKTPKNISGEDSENKIFDKLSARLLYVPYQLFNTKNNEQVQIQLHNPIPVGLACEIFK